MWIRLWRLCNCGNWCSYRRRGGACILGTGGGPGEAVAVEHWVEGEGLAQQHL